MLELELASFFSNVQTGKLITALYFLKKVHALESSGITDVQLNNMATALCRGHLSRGEITAAERASLYASGYARLTLSQEIIMAKRRGA